MQILLNLDPTQGSTLQSQLSEQMTALIRGGQLKAGQMLPSSRELSRQLGVSRNTVSEVYGRLATDGYIHTVVARGTFVRSAMPEDAMLGGAKAIIEKGVPPAAVNLPLPYSARGLPGLFSPPDPDIRTDFRFGRADAQSFPVKTWRRLLLECLGGAPERISQYNDPSGLPDLRELIAAFVGPARGINAKADDIIVVSGFQQGIDLTAHLLVGVNAPVLIEAPCYRGAAFLFESYGGRVSPIAIDDSGLLVDRLPEGIVKLVYVTPSHQFPTGVTMSLERRLQLLEWAARVGAYILEVDYDVDFRYEGEILPSLYSLDRNNCVIYLNSFSRSLGPGLRLGYMILPPSLLRAASILKGLIDNGCPWLEQATLAQFMRNRSLDEQIKRVRRTYMRRRDAVVASLAEQFGDTFLTGSEGGTHMLWRVPEHVGSAREIARKARSVGIGLHPLEDGAVLFHQSLQGSERSILIGYTHLAEPQIIDGITRIARAVCL